ncbi:glutamate-5-semialdehyde dehydrogenase [Bacillus mangrovi]|uniref:Gamma-glutamyl phosphate reductase n=1 Tax=Metabacillus mangrovi TaxID=1491830 RepID=A0A7X2S183_9BACI|nr:glutamate-5-semialdehyde dehydrogenase [Metabacillus mangrovi]MTH51969.1 glutamate-5-semialdehyde dehydrogenase [Metabacillus mangrovi]
MTAVIERQSVETQAKKAKQASYVMQTASEEEKNHALLILADELEKNMAFLLKENEKDLDNGRAKGYDEAYMDRLKLDEERIKGFSEGLRQVSELEDPSGVTLEKWILDNGLEAEKVSVPLGVIGMIYEARPNVTADAAGLAIKSGNAIVLKGGSSAIHSNAAIARILREGLTHTKLPEEAVQFISSTDREAARELFTMKEHIDVLIPRGGGALIQAVVENATVPVLETGVGNCHLYIDENADADKALPILINAKTDRPAVCNAAETLLIHEKWLKKYKDVLNAAFNAHGIQVHGDETAVQHMDGAKKAEEKDWTDEYLSLDIAMKVVSGLDEAIGHINEYGTKHSEAIITEDEQTAEEFLNRVDAAAVYHNASTRFTDGSALGFGAEIGISTQKLHARGPMGLPALTTVKIKLRGNGQIR